MCIYTKSRREIQGKSLKSQPQTLCYEKSILILIKLFFSQDLAIKRNKNTYQSFYKLIFLAHCVYINNYVFQGGSLQHHLSCLH